MEIPFIGRFCPCPSFISNEKNTPLTKQETSAPVTSTVKNDPIDDLVKISQSPSNTQAVKAATLELHKSGKATIPLIDLNAISKAQGDERKLLIQQFGEGLKQYGFIAVKADSIVNIVNDVNREMHSYFHQPLAEKMKDWRDNNGQTGFSQQGRETAAGAKKADIKETYFIPPNYNDWPKERPGFTKTMQQYHQELSKYQIQIMSFFQEYLGVFIEEPEYSMKCSENLIRLAYYPAPNKDHDPEAVWAAAHKDLNAFTLLPPSTVPGLEMLTRAGVWVPVVVPPGYLIVNLGEEVEQKTGGQFIATPHRVLNPGGEYARKERFASIFFGSWSPNCSLSPIKKCLDEMTKGMTVEEKAAYMKKFPDVSVNDNLISRLIEMNTFKHPPKEMVIDLRTKGLLRSPTPELVKLYPDVFNTVAGKV